MATQQQITEVKVLLNNEQAKKQLADLQKRYDEVKQKRDNALAAGDTKGWKQYQKDLDKIDRQLSKQLTSMQNVNRALDNLSTAKPKELRQTISEINRLLDSGSVERNSEEWKSLQAAMSDAKRELQVIKAEQNAFNEKEGVGFFSKLVPSGILDSFSKIGSSFMGLKSMITTGIAAMQQAIDAARWFVDYNRQVEEATRLTREFLSLTGSDLRQTYADIKAVADVYGKDYKEVLTTVDALTAQYQLTSKEAVAVITDGFQSGADVGGRMLSLIQQYAPTFHDAGVSAKELVGYIQQTRSGIFSEQGLALISMGSKRIREMSSATAKSLDAIGLSSQKIMEDLSSGALTTTDVIRQISAQLRTLPQDSREVGEVLKDVFGRQGAQGGLQMIRQLDTMVTDLDQLKQTTGEYGELQRRQVELQAQLNEKMAETFGIGESGFEEMGLKAKTWLLETLISVIDYFQQLYDDIGLIRGAVETVRVVFDSFFKVVELGFDVIVALVSATAKTIKGLAMMVEGLFSLNRQKWQQGWQDVLDGLAETGIKFASQAKDIGRRWGENCGDAFSKAFNGRTREVSVTLDEVVVTGKGRSAGGTRNTGTGGSKKDPYAEELKKLEQAQKQEQTLRRLARYENIISEEELQRSLFDIDMRYLALRMQLQQKYGKDVSDVQLAVYQRTAQEAQRQLENEQRAAKARFDAWYGQAQARKKTEDAARQKREADAKQLSDRMKQTEQSVTRQIEQNKRDEVKAEQDAARQRQQVQQALYQEISGTLQSASQLFQSMQQAAVSQVESRYDRQIAAAQKAGRDTSKLEKKKEAEVNAIKRRYADKEFQMKVLSITADTAMAIARQFKDLPFYAALGTSALVAAQGAMQLAVAKQQQQQAAKSGYYEGGFTGGRRYRREAGVVHEGEFVANHFAVENPAIMPALQLIDRAQRNNTVSRLTADDVAHSLRVSGGSAAAPPTVVSAPTVNVTTDNTELRRTLDRLGDLLSQPLGVDIPIDGHNGLYQRLRDYENLLKNK